MLPPADVASQAYTYGAALAELAPAIPARRRRDPLVVVWVRGDDAAGRAIGSSCTVEAPARPAPARGGGRDPEGPAGVAILAVWPDADDRRPPPVTTSSGQASPSLLSAR